MSKHKEWSLSIQKTQNSTTPVASSSMMKKNEKKQVKRKYSCDEPDCQKSYTQSHNLKSHKKNKHNL